MKQRCSEHNRTLMRVGYGVLICPIAGCQTRVLDDTLPPLFRNRRPLKRTPLRWKGRKAKTRKMKSGRVVLGRKEYVKLALDAWERGKGRCEIRHQPGCWGRLPYFSLRWIDHITKRSQGGSDTLENVRLGCLPCHNWSDNEGGKLIERKEREVLRKN